MIAHTAEPSFTFVIPAFNEERHIAACLESVLAQRYSAFDVIVVDDGSTDGTPKTVEGFVSSERVLLLSHEQSSGAGAARNSGIQRASGEVVVFLDADDCIPTDFLERLIPIYREGADAVAVESCVADRDSV